MAEWRVSREQTEAFARAVSDGLKAGMRLPPWPPLDNPQDYVIVQTKNGRRAVRKSPPPGGSSPMPAAVSRPYVNRDPANAADAAKCPVHQTRMQYDPADESWVCKVKRGSDEECGFRGHPRVKDLVMLRSTKYSGQITLYAVEEPGADGQPGTNIYMVLKELGMVVDVTGYIDLGDDAAVDIDEKTNAARITLQFDEIHFAQIAPGAAAA